MLDTFESPQDGIAGVGDTMRWDAMGGSYAAASPTGSDDSEDEILDDDLDADGDDLDDDDDLDLDDEDDDDDDDDLEDDDDLDDDIDDDLVDLDDEYDTEKVERNHRGPGRGKYED